MDGRSAVTGRVQGFFRGDENILKLIVNDGYLTLNILKPMNCTP